MESVIGDLGPCAVIFNGVDLGPTLGDVKVKYTTEQRDIKEDQQGVTPIDGIFVGSTTQVTIPLTRTTLAKLSSCIPGATCVSPYTLMKVDVLVGVSRYSRAYALILKKMVGNVASTDPDQWITFQKASAAADLEITFNNENQRVFNLMFQCFPSQSTPVGEVWRIGS